MDFFFARRAEVKLFKVDEKREKTGFSWKEEEYEKSGTIWYRYQYEDSGLFLKFDKENKELIIGKQTFYHVASHRTASHHIIKSNNNFNAAPCT